MIQFFFSIKKIKLTTRCLSKIGTEILYLITRGNVAKNDFLIDELFSKKNISLMVAKLPKSIKERIFQV